MMWLIVLKGNHDIDGGDDIDDGTDDIDGGHVGNGGDDDVDSGEWNAGKVLGSRPIPREKVSMTPQTLWLHTRIHKQCEQRHKYTNTKYAGLRARDMVAHYVYEQCKKCMNFLESKQT